MGLGKVMLGYPVFRQLISGDFLGRGPAVTSPKTKEITARTDEADPLATGLEVMASPPGKKLQSLSLLSGGEQALTAIALRFAVFLSKRAPICVLDEVDAPLDDANVDRLCSLLEDLARDRTRFLVITHHRLTMARMHRLYGVTMMERGVSQLVSVEIQRADAWRSAG